MRTGSNPPDINRFLMNTRKIIINNHIFFSRCVENYPPNVTVTNRHTILNLSNQQSSSQQNSLLSTKEQQKGHKIITKYKEFMYKNFPKLRGRKLNDTKVLQFITTLRKLAAQNKNQQVRHQNLQGNSEVTQEKNSPNQQENQQRQEQREKNERLSNYFENKTNERNELKKSTYSQSNVEERQQNSWQMVNEQIPLTIEQPRQSPSKTDHIKVYSYFSL